MRNRLLASKFSLIKTVNRRAGGNVMAAGAVGLTDEIGDGYQLLATLGDEDAALASA
jgi:hypothetical protein